MKTHEKTVREAAASLHDAIVAARRNGFDIQWPAKPDGLKSLAISETAKAEHAAPAPAAKAK